MAGFAVDADVLDALNGPRLVNALDLLENALWRSEEADNCAAYFGSRLQRGRPDRLAERCLEGETVEVDAEREFCELRVVATPEPRRDLDHLRAVRTDAELRVAGAVLDPERTHRSLRDLRRLPTRFARPHMRQRNTERGRLGRQSVGD